MCFFELFALVSEEELVFALALLLNNCFLDPVLIHLLLCIHTATQCREILRGKYIGLSLRHCFRVVLVGVLRGDGDRSNKV